MTQDNLPLDPNAPFIDHGTAMIGILAAGDNGYGTTGIAPDANFYVYPIEPQGFDTCLYAAIEDSHFGDVILIENAVGGGQGFGGPNEMGLSVWTMINDAKDEVIIVEPTGNDPNNLNGTEYSNWLSRGDSGAILVSGGKDNKYHGNDIGGYGSKVDVQNWGLNVFTTWSDYPLDVTNYQYASGTSAASALTAGACAILQSAAELYMGRRLAPSEMRKLLKTSGTRQEEGYPIGRFVNLQKAVECIMNQSGGGNFNYPPVVDANNDTILYWPSNVATIAANVTDDPGETFMYTWSQIGGPAFVSFGNPYNYITTVTFPQIGKYTLYFSCTDSGNNVSGDSIVVYVSRPSAVGHSDLITDGEAACRDLTTSGNYAYYITGSGLKIMNITNMASPTTVGLWSNTDLIDVEVEGNYAYVADDDSSVRLLRIINVQDPANPVEAGLYNPNHDLNYGFAVRNDMVYLAQGTEGVKFVDVSIKSSPNIVNQYLPQFQDLQMLRLSGNYLYLNDKNVGLVILNVSNVMTPVQAGSLNYTGKTFLDMEVAGDFVYVLVEGEGVKIIDVTNKNIPVEAASYATTDSQELAYSDGYLYLRLTTKEIKIIDVRNSTQPVLDGAYSAADLRYNNFLMSYEKIYSPQDGKNMFILGRYDSYYVNWQDSLVILDTAQGATPEPTVTAVPTATPTSTPISTPTSVPTATPTSVPTATPTSTPVSTPTSAPTATPTSTPISTPTSVPTATPTSTPVSTPTSVPTATPISTPTSVPTATPTSTPISTPTSVPTATPTVAPTVAPTTVPGSCTTVTTTNITFNTTGAFCYQTQYNIVGWQASNCDGRTVSVTVNGSGTPVTTIGGALPAKNPSDYYVFQWSAGTYSYASSSWW